MTTRSTHSTRLSTRSTRLSICLSIRNTRQSTRSTRTTICRSFYNWSTLSMAVVLLTNQAILYKLLAYET